MSLSNESDETLVILQFTDIDDANYSQQFSNKFKTIDIESANPIIQIGNRFYKGEYTNNIGTYLFFEQKQQQQQRDQDLTEDGQNTESQSTGCGDASKSEYSGKSFKKLVLNRLFIEERND